MSKGWSSEGGYRPHLSPNQMLYNSLLDENYTLAKQLIDVGARLDADNMKYVNHGTEWYKEFIFARNQCAKASRIVTSLRKPGMDPNLFKMLGKYVWSCRDRVRVDLLYYDFTQTLKGQPLNTKNGLNKNSFKI